MYWYRFYALGYLTTLVCASLNNLLDRAANGREYGWYPDVRTGSHGEDCDITKSLPAAEVSEAISILLSIDHSNKSVTTLTSTVTLTETMTAQAQTTSAMAGTVTSLITINDTVTMSATSTLTITVPAMSSTSVVAGTMASSVATTNPTTISIHTSSRLNTSQPTSSMLSDISFSLVTSSSNHAITTTENTTSTLISKTSSLPAISVANNSDIFSLQPSTSSVTAAKVTTNTGSRSGGPFRVLSTFIPFAIWLLFL